MSEPQQIPTGIQTIILADKPKSVLVAGLLTILFGPLGLLYVSVAGGLVMLVISTLVAAFTFGFGLLVTWPLCVAWGCTAAAMSRSDSPRIIGNQT